MAEAVAPRRARILAFELDLVVVVGLAGLEIHLLLELLRLELGLGDVAVAVLLLALSRCVRRSAR